MLNSISDIITIIESFLKAVWLILIEPGSFEKNFLTQEPEVESFKPHSLLLFSILTFSVTSNRIDIYQDDWLSETYNTFSNFSLNSFFKLSIQIFSLNTLFAWLTSKIACPKNKELFKKHYRWVIIMISFHLILLCSSFLLTFIVDSLIQASYLSLNTSADDIFFIVFIICMLISILWPFLIIYLNIKKGLKDKEPTNSLFTKKNYLIATLFPILFFSQIFIAEDTSSHTNDMPLLITRQSDIFCISGNSENTKRLRLKLDFIWQSKQPVYLYCKDSFELKSEQKTMNTLKIDSWSAADSKIMVLKQGELYSLVLEALFPDTSTLELQGKSFEIEYNTNTASANNDTEKAIINLLKFTTPPCLLENDSSACF